MIKYIINLIFELYQKIVIIINHRKCCIDGITLLLPKKVISDELAYRLIRGNYDYGDRVLIDKYVYEGDYLVEIGGGIGLTAMVAYRKVGVEGSVLTLEADPEIHNLAVKNFKINDMKIQSLNVAVVANSNKKVKFSKSKHFWSSNITGYGNYIEKEIIVDTIYLPSMLEDMNILKRQKKVLICDVEGYEARLLSDTKLLQLFDLMIVEVHNDNAIRPKANGEDLALMFNTIAESGFFVKDTLGGTFVFSRN